MNKFDKHFWIPYIILLALTLIRLIPYLHPESQTWGFNHLIFLPAGYSITFLLLAVIGLIIPFLKISEVWSDCIIEWFSTNFIEKTEGTNIYNSQREQLLNMINLIGSGSKAP